MKTSLDHLPANKQEELQEIIPFICSKLKPEMIILFGSYARGDWVEDVYREEGITYEYKSDYDFLVVVEDPKQVKYVSPWRKVEKRLREWSKIQTPVNIIRLDIHALNQSLAKGQYFYSDIKKEGILLFDSKKFKLADAIELNPKERIKEAEKYYKHWFDKALDFKEHFYFDMRRKKYSMGAFQLHQATESLYTAILLVFTGYRPKSHDLEFLESLADSQFTGIGRMFPKTTEKQKELFELLRSAYVDARYDENFQIKKKDLEWLAERVEKLKELTEKICTDKIKSFQTIVSKTR